MVQSVLTNSFTVQKIRRATQNIWEQTRLLLRRFQNTWKQYPLTNHSVSQLLLDSKPRCLMTNSTPGKRIYQILTAPMRDIPPRTDVTRPRLHLHDRFFNNGAPFSVYPFFKFYFFSQNVLEFFYTVAAVTPGPPFSCLRANRIWQKGGDICRGGGTGSRPF